MVARPHSERFRFSEELDAEGLRHGEAACAQGALVIGQGGIGSLQSISEGCRIED